MTVVTIKESNIMEPAKSDINDIVYTLSVNQTIIDNHNDSEMIISGVVVLSHGFVCPVLANKLFCLNYLYTSQRDGKIHLSQTSVGGNMDMRNGKSLGDAVDAYNKERDGMIAMGMNTHHIISYIDLTELPVERTFVDDDAAGSAQEIISHIMVHGREYIDNHNGSKCELQGFIVLNTGYVSPLFRGTVFCINRMYIDKEGKLCLSKMSVAGNVDTRGVTTEEAIKRFNDDMDKGTLRSRIIDFHEFE